MLSKEKKALINLNKLFEPKQNKSIKRLITKLKDGYGIGIELIAALGGIEKHKLINFYAGKKTYSYLSPAEKRMIWVIYQVFTNPHNIISRYRIVYWSTWGEINPTNIYTEKDCDSFKKALENIESVNQMCAVAPQVLSDLFGCGQEHAGAIIAASGYGDESFYQQVIDINR